jgi:VanZ family protein
MMHYLLRAVRFPGVVRWSIWASFLTAWTVGLLIPMSHVPPPPSGQTWAVFINDKFLHCVAYAILAVLTGWLKLPTGYRWLLIGLLAFHAYATEFLQQFVPTRDMSLADVGMDLAGILLGLVVTWRWWFSWPAANVRERVDSAAD